MLHQASDSTPRWLGGDAGVSAHDAPIRLFCFAHAGGGAAFFRPWRLELAAQVDVRPVVLPGREFRVRELPYRRMDQLIDPLCEALAPHLDRPYAFFGHSLGSVLAFEAAARLSAGPGPGPVLLAVSGRRAPGEPSRRGLYSALSDAQFLNALRALGGTPPELLAEPQFLGMMLPTLRADFELNESYRPRPEAAVSCPIAAYAGDDDTEVDRAELLEWRWRTTGEFTLRLFPGGHFYLKDDRLRLREALCQDLRRALEHRGLPCGPLAQSSGPLTEGRRPEYVG